MTAQGDGLVDLAVQELNRVAGRAKGEKDCQLRGQSLFIVRTAYVPIRISDRPVSELITPLLENADPQPSTALHCLLQVGNGYAGMAEAGRHHVDTEVGLILAPRNVDQLDEAATLPKLEVGIFTVWRVWKGKEHHVDVSAGMGQRNGSLLATSVRAMSAARLVLTQSPSP